MDATRGKQLVQSLLTKSNVLIKDVESTALKITKILNDGADNLHLVCDFDQTLSRYWIRDHATDALERNCSCHNLPLRYSKFGYEYKHHVQGLLETYYPIEVDPTKTEQEKLPYMVEWSRKSHAALVSQHITRSDIQDMVKESGIQLRTGIPVLLGQCHHKQIPVLIFSAGISDIIQETLREHSLLTPNVQVVSNMMLFNKEGVCAGFSSPIIDVFKSESPMEEKCLITTENRTNMMLLGDSLGDLNMGKSIPHDLSLSIGFCNHDFDTLVPLFTEAYDIVILYDGSANPILEIINSL